MDGKGSKRKQVISDDNRYRAWPDLPEQLIELISKQLSLVKSVSFDGVDKGWMQKPSTQEFPMLMHISYYEFWCKRNVYSSELLCRSNGPSPEDDPIIGSSQGELILRSQTKPHGYYLWSQLGSYKRHLPEICGENVKIRRIVLSSSPDYKTNSTVLVLTSGYNKGGFMFCKTKKRDKIWVKEECTLLDPNSTPNNRSTIEFTNAVFFKGKFYALSLQGTLAVIDTDSESPHRVRILGAKRAIPTTWSRYFKEYMIESCGEILLVFLILSKLVDRVDHVEVFRLDLENMSWVKMESLGKQALFLGSNCCVPVSEASKLGFRANCVYFTRRKIDGWQRFEMESGTIKPGLNDGTSSTTPLTE